MLDPLKLSLAVNLIFMVAFGVTTAVAVCYRAEAIVRRRAAMYWLRRFRAMRRRAIAYRASVPPPTGYKAGLPYWDSYELNRFAEKCG